MGRTAFDCLVGLWQLLVADLLSLRPQGGGGGSGVKKSCGIILKDLNFHVITVRAKTSNRDTEKSQKVHSFGQLIC